MASEMTDDGNLTLLPKKAVLGSILAGLMLADTGGVNMDIQISPLPETKEPVTIELVIVVLLLSTKCITEPEEYPLACLAPRKTSGATRTPDAP